METTRTESTPRTTRKSLRALGLMALSTLACRMTDFMFTDDPLMNVARGGAGSALLMAEIFGTKWIKNALTSDTDMGKAVGKLALSVAVPLMGAALSYEYPIASYALFYVPILSALAWGMRRD
ncbi:MAG: hypothetical protein WA061_00170 [Microgenomates group bacterium]